MQQARALIYSGADHLEVHLALKKMQVPDAMIKEVLVGVEPDFVKYQLAEQGKTKVLNQMLVGVFILILGISFTVYSVLVVGYTFKLCYAVLLAGVWWTFRNYRIYRQPIEYFIPSQEFYRKRRFRK